MFSQVFVLISIKIGCLNIIKGQVSQTTPRASLALTFSQWVCYSALLPRSHLWSIEIVYWAQIGRMFFWEPSAWSNFLYSEEQSQQWHSYLAGVSIGFNRYHAGYQWVSYRFLGLIQTPFPTFGPIVLVEGPLSANQSKEESRYFHIIISHFHQVEDKPFPTSARFRRLFEEMMMIDKFQYFNIWIIDLSH